MEMDNTGKVQRWSIVLTVLIAIFGCTQNSTSGFKSNSKPDGFAGIRWGTEFSEVKSGMVELMSTNDPAEPNVKIKIYYTKQGDDLKMGEAQVDKIEYVFWRGKFAEARINASGSENFDRLKRFLFEKYGTVNKFQGAYSWEGSIARIALRYDEPTKTSLLTIASTKLASEEVKDVFEKGKELLIPPRKD